MGSSMNNCHSCARTHGHTNHLKSLPQEYFSRRTVFLAVFMCTHVKRRETNQLWFTAKSLLRGMSHVVFDLTGSFCCSRPSLTQKKELNWECQRTCLQLQRFRRGLCSSSGRKALIVASCILYNTSFTLVFHTQQPLISWRWAANDIVPPYMDEAVVTNLLVILRFRVIPCYSGRTHCLIATFCLD